MERKNSQLQDLQRQEGGGKFLWNISELVQGTLGIMEQRPRVARDIVCTCVVLHNVLRTYKFGSDREPIPINDGVARPNEQALYLPLENYRNPSREAKHQ